MSCVSQKIFLSSDLTIFLNPVSSRPELTTIDVNRQYMVKIALQKYWKWYKINRQFKHRSWLTPISWNVNQLKVSNPNHHLKRQFIIIPLIQNIRVFYHNECSFLVKIKKQTKVHKDFYLLFNLNQKSVILWPVSYTHLTLPTT